MIFRWVRKNISISLLHCHCNSYLIDTVIFNSSAVFKVIDKSVEVVALPYNSSYFALFATIDNFKLVVKKFALIVTKCANIIRIDAFQRANALSVIY